MYAQQRCREEVRMSSRSLEGYYRSLQMRMRVRAVATDTIARASQLTQKTNQFNMTTRRYSEAEIEAMVAGGGYRAWTVQLTDRFGDSGVVGLMIVEAMSAVWRINTLLMSCRVIGRTVETAMLAWLANQARLAGVRTLVGEYIPTRKNAPAAAVYAGHGFAALNTGGNSTDWAFDVESGTIVFPEWIELSDLEVS